MEAVEKVKPCARNRKRPGKGALQRSCRSRISKSSCAKRSAGFLSGCGGKIYTAKSDKDGDFVITNVQPKEYPGIDGARFRYRFIRLCDDWNSGNKLLRKYNVVADKTLFVVPTHLFKGDLKGLNPRAG